MVDGDGVIAQSKNTVESAKGKSQARLAGGLGKVLALNLEVANGQDVVGDEARQAAGSVVDLELAAVALVSGRVRRLVLGVEVAGDAAALLGGNPEVRAARIEDNLECLGRGTDGDLGEVCSMSVLGVTREEERGSHWAFMKLETGTGWTPSVLATSDLNM